MALEMEPLHLKLFIIPHPSLLQLIYLRPLIWNEMSDTEDADAPDAQALENPGFRRPQITPPKPLMVDGDRADYWKLWKKA